MLLRNVCIVDEQEEGLKDVLIRDGVIQEIADSIHDDPATIDLNGAIAFPGLINSHDHLNFNLFPQLGNPVYKSYIDWGKDIHANNKEAIAAVLKIPESLRIQYGIYKNLLNGVTTVVNHGEPLNIANSPIAVHQRCHSLHSVAFERLWKWKLNRPFAGNNPFVIHIGEGTTPAAIAEIDTLLRWNLFNRKLIGIHGVSMTPAQATRFKALVWCPASNVFMLNKTARVNVLKRYTSVIFGSDSTLSAEWNIWNHLRLARKTGMLTDRELFESLTVTPASVWGLNDRGKIAQGLQADIVVVRGKKEAGSMDAFFNINPDDILLVVQRGQVRLFDAAIYDQMVASKTPVNGFSAVSIGEHKKYVIGNLPELVQKIRSYHPLSGLSLSFI